MYIYLSPPSTTHTYNDESGTIMIQNNRNHRLFTLRYVCTLQHINTNVQYQSSLSYLISSMQYKKSFLIMNATSTGPNKFLILF